jgi:hypothetical protein
MSGLRGSAGAHIDREVRFGAEERMACQSSTQQGDEAGGYGPHGSTSAHLSKEVRSRAVGHVAAPEPTSAGRCDPKVQLAW